MSSATGDLPGTTAPPGRSERTPRPREHEEWSPWERRCDRLRWVLVLAWLALAVVTVVVGERETSWGHLKEAVGDGDVAGVRILGEVPPGEGGGGMVTVWWRDGIVHRVTEVRQVRDRPPSQVLHQLDPDVQVLRASDRLDSFTTLAGWRVPGVSGVVVVLLLAAWLGLLVVGPQPWRATRWAWFWLALPPFGIVVFLLLSGPTPGVPRPRRPARRLTGVGAFLLSLLLGAGWFGA